MAYTNVWDDSKPTGSEAANTIDDIFRSVKVDLEQRFIDLFNMANFTADPLRPGGLKFYDTADAKLFFGDNAGTPRGILLRDKADTLTYAQWLYTGITLTPPTLAAGSIPFFNVTQTWNNGATSFVGLFVNITSTASLSTSKLFDFQVASSSKLNLDRTGILNFSNLILSSTGVSAPVIAGTNYAGMYCNTLTGLVLVGYGPTSDFSLQPRGSEVMHVNAGSSTVSINTNLTVAGGVTAVATYLAISSTNKLFLDGIGGAGDTYIVESSANIMGLVCGGTTSLDLTATTAAFGSLALSGITTLLATSSVTALTYDLSAGGIFATARLYRTALDGLIIAGIAGTNQDTAIIDSVGGSGLYLKTTGAYIGGGAGRIFGGAGTLSVNSDVIAGATNTISLRPGITYSGGSITPADSVSVANNGTLDLGDATHNAVFVIVAANGQQAVISCAGGVHTTTIFGSFGAWSVTSGTGASVNVFWNAGSATYRLENKSGGSLTFRIVRLAGAITNA